MEKKDCTQKRSLTHIGSDTCRIVQIIRTCGHCRLRCPPVSPWSVTHSRLSAHVRQTHRPQNASCSFAHCLLVVYVLCLTRTLLICLLPPSSLSLSPSQLPHSPSLPLDTPPHSLSLSPPPLSRTNAQANKPANKDTRARARENTYAHAQTHTTHTRTNTHTHAHKY